MRVWGRYVLLLTCLALYGCEGVATDPSGADAAGWDADVDAAHLTDAGGTDAGPGDAGAMDAGAMDAGAMDAGAVDAGAVDAGPMDAGPMDAGPMDAGPMDAGPMDAGAMDAGADSGSTADAGPSDAGSPLARVLLLHDDGSQAQVQAALEAAGHTVVLGPRFDAWNGADPDPTTFDMIVWLEGAFYAGGFTPEADDALVVFVESGGLLVRMEWGAWNVYFGRRPAPNDDTDNLMPVRCPLGAFATNATWTVLDTTHALTAGLPATFAVTGSYSSVSAVSEAVVLIDDGSGNPMLTTIAREAGAVVHINQDGAGTASTIDGNVLRILSNAAAMSAM